MLKAHDASVDASAMRMARMPILAVSGALALAPLTQCTPPGATSGGAAVAANRPVVLVIGDSLTFEASDAILATADGRADVRVFGAPGTAVCDHLAGLRRQIRTLKPAAVVLQFSGNNLTPCTKRLDGSALVTRYAKDMAKAMTTVGSRIGVYWVGAPPIAGDPERVRGVRDLDAAMAQRYANARYVPAGDQFGGPGAAFRTRLPCRVGESCDPDGQTTVRAADGVHFCPTVYAKGEPCAVPSPGAVRFARAMIEPVLADLAV